MRNRLLVLGALSVGVLTLSLSVSAQAPPRGAVPPAVTSKARALCQRSCHFFSIVWGL